MTTQENETTAQPEINQESKANDFSSMLATITREDGTQKYGSVEDALKSIPYKEQHLSKIEKENQELRNKLEELNNKVLEVNANQELVELLKKQVEEGNTKKSAADGTEAVDLNNVLANVNSIVEEKLQKAETEKIAQQRLDEFLRKAQNQYGANWEKELELKATENNMDAVTLQAMVISNPVAATNLIFGSNKKTPASPSLGGLQQSLSANPLTEIKPNTDSLYFKSDQEKAQYWNSLGEKVTEYVKQGRSFTDEMSDPKKWMEWRNKHN